MSDYVTILESLDRGQIADLIASGFDPHYYLQANPDVASAGWPAIEHYMKYGWREGRLPSSDFAVFAHLFDGPDLHQRGIPPFALYLLMQVAGTPLEQRWHFAQTADPLQSHRIRGYADYAAALTGYAGWADSQVTRPPHGALRRMAAMLRQQLGTHIGQPIVLLPAEPWPGAMEISLCLSEQGAAFICLSNTIAVDRWQAELMTMIDLTSASAGDAELLLVDALRGTGSSLLIDLGAWILREAPSKLNAIFANRAKRYLACVPPELVPDTAAPDWAGIVRVAAAGETAVGPAAIAPLTMSGEKLRARIAEMCEHAV